MINKFTATPPAISGLSPASGTTAGGTVVTITGSSFIDVSSVNFGNVPATSWTVNSPTQITATAPAQAAGMVYVRVSTVGGSSTNWSQDQYTYTAAPAPSLSGVSPNSGGTNGLTQVTVTGTNFTGATAVTFGGAAAIKLTVNSPTSLTAWSPVPAPAQPTCR